jgi:acyl-CoA synthetase (AMP-forming)/AMP-acid ligase II
MVRNDLENDHDLPLRPDPPPPVLNSPRALRRSPQRRGVPNPVEQGDDDNQNLSIILVTSGTVGTIAIALALLANMFYKDCLKKGVCSSFD